MFLGNNFRGTNLTIPIHRGIINRKDDETQKKGMKKWMLLPVIILVAGLLAVIYLTPARTGEDDLRLRPIRCKLNTRRRLCLVESRQELVT